MVECYEIICTRVVLGTIMSIEAFFETMDPRGFSVKSHNEACNLGLIVNGDSPHLTKRGLSPLG